ncbi:MAG: type II toxin-antitoxin system antitoxin SocA domain-containing protein [Minisyncoccia bacterium]
MSTWIKTKRKEAGFSQSFVSESLGISRPTYTNLENGKSKLTEEQKNTLARLFSMSEKKVEQYSKITVNNKEDVVDFIREVPKENVEKFQEVLLYILGKVGSRPNIGQTALYKLLYFIDFDYYEKFNKYLIGATYIKNTYGPTPVSFKKITREMEENGELVEVKSKYFNHDQTKYVPVKEANVDILTGRELKHIDDELEKLAHLTAKELSERSHIDTPWLVAEERQVLNYRHVFYRPEETSVGEYETL